jgi:hypothetical protein
MFYPRRLLKYLCTSVDSWGITSSNGHEIEVRNLLLKIDLLIDHKMPSGTRTRKVNLVFLANAVILMLSRLPLLKMFSQMATQLPNYNFWRHVFELRADTYSLHARLQDCFILTHN